MPPRAFGKYEVLARLATGGAASIFLARQPGAAGFAKLVCLKTLLPERASDEDFVAMFLDEARLAALLNHPNCVQIYDLGKVRGIYYISMEYIFGETLWNLLTTVTQLRIPLPTSQVAHIIASVCDGLQHAHDLTDAKGRPYSLVHRDVSPQNVMVTFEGQTKVVDFGIAKAHTGRIPTQSGIVKGKFSYMSPEQITGSPVDRRSDIFSLGIVMFECLASRRLYRGSSPEDIARLILEHRAPRLRDVVPDTPPELDEICARALVRERDQRFQTAQEMGDALRAYLDKIRYNQSSSALAHLMVERFGTTIAERRAVYEGALNDTYIERDLLRVMDAQPVREIDLFSDLTDDDDDEDSLLDSDLRPAQEVDDDDVHSIAALGESSPSDRTGGFVPETSDATKLDMMAPAPDMEEFPILGSASMKADDPFWPSEISVTPFQGLSPLPLDPADLDRIDAQLMSSVADDQDEEDMTQHVVIGQPAAPPEAPTPSRSPVYASPAPSRPAPAYGGAAAELEERIEFLVRRESEVAARRHRPIDRSDSFGSTVLDQVSVASSRLEPAHPPPQLVPPPPPDYRSASQMHQPHPTGPFERPRYSLAVVWAALAFGISLGLVLGVLVARVALI